jgi:hypothetical protein
MTVGPSALPQKRPDAFAYLRKPFTAQMLIDAIKKAVS